MLLKQFFLQIVIRQKKCLNRIQFNSTPQRGCNTIERCDAGFDNLGEYWFVRFKVSKNFPLIIRD